MSKLTQRQFCAGLIAAALTFRQQEEERESKAALRAMGDNPQPKTTDEEELWAQFDAFVGEVGITQQEDDSDISCFAGLRPNEPSFTLRGQDILASMMVRHWAALYEGLAPTTSQAKIDGATDIAEAMEMYHTQKWAD